MNGAMKVFEPMSFCPTRNHQAWFGGWKTTPKRQRCSRHRYPSAGLANVKRISVDSSSSCVARDPGMSTGSPSRLMEARHWLDEYSSAKRSRTLPVKVPVSIRFFFAVNVVSQSRGRLSWAITCRAIIAIPVVTPAIRIRRLSLPLSRFGRTKHSGCRVILYFSCISGHKLGLTKIPGFATRDIHRR